jgi:2-polyprenyl-3-methyl-5-hydroxy-6-metoxy-1,4-benzoquinol methylase
MRPWLPVDQLTRLSSVSDPKETLGGLGSLLRVTRALAGRTTMAQKLRFYDHFLAYLRCIGLFLSWKAGWYQAWQQGDAPSKEGFDLRQFQALKEMLQGLGILEEKGLNPLFDQLAAADFSILQQALFEQLPSGKLSSTPFQRLLDSIFIMENLLEVYRGDQPKKLRPEVAPWIPLLQNGELDYEIRLLYTLRHLRSLTLRGKVRSPFPDAFFTQSGERAFRQYTRERFLRIVEEMETDAAPIQSVLDVGCGYGDYLEALLTQRADRRLVGLELQEEVAEKTTDRLSSYSNVQISTDDVMQHQTSERYDLVLLNYVLFYFSGDQQRALLERLAELVSPGGYLLVCQYFPGMELLKQDLARQLRDYSLARQVEMYYGSKIVYANALWNEAILPFQEALQWEEWLAKLAESGWEVSHLGPADRFYYSLFLGIKQSPSTQ